MPTGECVVPCRYPVRPTVVYFTLRRTGDFGRPRVDARGCERAIVQGLLPAVRYDLLQPGMKVETMRCRRTTNDNDTVAVSVAVGSIVCVAVVSVRVVVR